MYIKAMLTLGRLFISGHPTSRRMEGFQRQAKPVSRGIEKTFMRQEIEKTESLHSREETITKGHNKDIQSNDYRR